MSPDVRDIEADLHRIRQACIKAVDDATGAVNNLVITEQAALLKKWVWELENVYVESAKKSPINSEKISSKGRELVDYAWTVYETILELEQRASEPPRPAKYEQLPSGIVSGATKSSALEELRELERKYETFRKEVLNI